MVRIVCAWCNKLIRIEDWGKSDKGTQVTGTSHGICPECAKQNKPEVTQ